MSHMCVYAWLHVHEEKCLASVAVIAVFLGRSLITDTLPPSFFLCLSLTHAHINTHRNLGIEVESSVEG